MDFSNDYGVPYKGTGTWQTVLNQSWPFVGADGKQHARGIPLRDPIDVRVGLEFERDGEVWFDAQAIRWHGRHVCVYVLDERLAVPYVWVDAGGVRRR